MLELPHALVGAAIASKVPNPIVSLPLAFASHFILDMLPHWNPHFFTETIKYGHPSKKSTSFARNELILATGILTAVSFTIGGSDMARAVIFLGGLAGMLPDIIKIPFFFLKKRGGLLEKYVLFERSIQNDTGPIWGITTQLLICLSALILLAQHTG